MSDNRYQFQPWYIKAWRWALWRPLYFVLACLWMPIAFVMCLFRSPWPCRSRWELLGSVFRQFASKAHYRMGAWLTTKEFLDSLIATTCVSGTIGLQQDFGCNVVDSEMEKP